MINIMLFLLSFFPPEISHLLTIKLLKLNKSKIIFKPNDNKILQQVIWNIEFSNPVGLAAGFDKNAEVIDETSNLGFGFVEIGTVTPRPQIGNEKPRVFRLKKDKAIINHLGFNNQGMEKVKKRLLKRYNKKYTTPAIVGLNVGKNFDSKDASLDYISCIKCLGPYVNYIVINISSPNTPGLGDLQNRHKLENLIVTLKKNISNISYVNNKPILIKISPDLNEEQKRDIALTSLAQGVDGLIVSNTTLTKPNLLKDSNKSEIGGLSGKPLFVPSTIILKEMYNFTGGKIPLIGVGGVSSGRDAYEKIKSGASLVQIYTGLVYEGPQLVNKINRELTYFLQADGFTNINEAIGADVR